ncbi:MAG TPA: hypothetical protein VNW04_09185, partial [Puia sp.]|nr:hypothetical protein [Puia sp.]
MKFLSRLVLLSLLLIVAGCPVFAQQQLTISGSTCVTPGTQYTYTMGGNFTGSTSVTWTCSGGSFVGSSSGTGLIHCTIVWNDASQGSINVTATGLTGSPSNGA